MDNVYTVTSQHHVFSELVTTRQNEICSALSAVDGLAFIEDSWTRPGGGGGKTRILESDTFEKAGVNTSTVFGEISKSEAPMFQSLVKKVNDSIEDIDHARFFATGISVVIHPKNPYVPTVHANYRYFECHTSQGVVWWMGGGADLTPYYVNNHDICHFHSVHRHACDEFSPGFYAVSKKACDDYFYLPHRKETRGVGGVFFDYLNDNFDAQLSFVSNISKAFIDAYIPIVTMRKDTPYSEDHRRWQSIRRGRYAEFNLLHDRGTLFGLKTSGRIESIFMSMPPNASWVYNYLPPLGSPEYDMQQVVLNPRDWA
jgi:coproporphyrinogen III oxidase